MTDHEQDHGSEDFDAPSQEAVRALLGDAATPAPLPDDVAAMLGETLDALVAERTSQDAPVVPLVRRRGLPGRRLLSAAAAVVLLGGVGVGMTQVLGTSGDDDSMATADTQSLAEAPVVPGSAGVESAPGADNGGTTTKDAPADLVRSLYFRLARTDFTRQGFAQQLSDLSAATKGEGPWFDQYSGQSDGQTGGQTGGQSGGLTGRDGSAPAPTGAANRNPYSGLDALKDLALGYQPSNRCTGPEIAQGSVLLGIRFEGKPATLVLHPVVDGVRYVAAWSCNGHELLAFATVPG